MINDIYTEMFGATAIGDAFHPCTLPTYEEIFTKTKAIYAYSEMKQCPKCETWVSMDNLECPFCHKES